jgi:hypothetical protein
VVETDIANCFSAIPHEKLMQAIEERGCDQAVLKLLRAMLRAGVMQDGVVRREVTGTPQGGVISPLMCNVYLHRINRVWDGREHGGAGPLRRRCRGDELGLEPKAAKTRIVHLSEGGPGLDFLGFHHRWVRAQGRTGTGKGVAFLARWPTSKAMQHARDHIRELTERHRVLLRVEVIVEDINRFIRGWPPITSTGTRPDTSTRSWDTRGCDWRNFSPRNTDAPEDSAGRSLPSSRRTPRPDQS